jgi:glucose-6-phosphate 1-dehydrogenase
MHGDHRRFGRADAIEEQWRIIERVVQDPPRVHLYDEGTLGPPEADALAAPAGGWVDPIPPGSATSSG